MSSTAKQVLVSLVCSGAAIGGYHAFLAPPPASSPVSTSDRDVHDALAALRREMAALRDEVRGGAAAEPTGSDAPAAPGSGALAARLAALEQRLVVDLGRTVPGGVGEKPSQWTEQQIADFRAMLEAVESRRFVERETASFRSMLRGVAPNLSPADENATVLLLTGFTRQVRDVFAAPGIRNTPEEYVATNKKAQEIRAKLLENLKGILSADVVEKVAERLPTFTVDDIMSPAAKSARDALRGAMEDEPK